MKIKVLTNKVKWYGSSSPDHRSESFNISHEHEWYIPNYTHALGHTNGHHIDKICQKCGQQQCGIQLFQMQELEESELYEIYNPN